MSDDLGRACNHQSAHTSSNAPASSLLIAGKNVTLPHHSPQIPYSVLVSDPTGMRLFWAPHSLDGLKDVIVPTAQIGDVLVFDGEHWLSGKVPPVNSFVNIDGSVIVVASPSMPPVGASLKIVAPGQAAWVE